MTDLSGTAMERTWHSLRRRKVVQWVLGYAAAAWTLLQVIEYFSETYAWPPAIRQIAALALPLGVSFVAVVAWFHGDRGEQRVSRIELAILAVLALGLGAMLWLYVSRLEEAAWIADDGLPPVRHVVPQDAPSVAVLPFVNMSDDPEQEYFADGLSEELLNALARIPGLYVPARTSSFQFKGKAGDVAKFAALLGVAHVLEGSVRKAEGRVRITAQLVKADDGYHVWSQTYDRELKDIFAIQTEISSAIAEALKLRLTAQQKQASTLAPPTSNMDAYEAYLLGRYEWETRTGPKRVENAMAHLQKAVALDPQFADAYALLARVSLGIGNKFLPTAEGRALADEYLRKAQALAPDRPLVLAVSGAMLYWGRTSSAPERDENGELIAAEKARLERVLDYFDRALAADPNQVSVIRWRALVLRQLGRPGNALAAVEEELKRNPLDANTLLGGIYHLAIRGRSAEAAPLVERLMAISPAQAHQQQAIHAFFFRGDNVGAARHWLLLYDLEQGTNPRTVSWLAGLFAVMGWQEEALHAAQAAPDSDAQTRIYFALGEYRKAAEAIRPTVTEDQWANACDLGHVLYLVPDLEGSQAAFATCWEKGEPTPGVGASRILMAADVERRLGNEAQARKYYRWFDESLRLWLADGIVPDRHLLAVYEAYGKHDEAALEHLVAAVTLDPWLATELRRYPIFAELVKRPEFRAAVERGRPRMERERAEVLQMLCGPHPVSTMYRPAPATCAKQSGP